MKKVKVTVANNEILHLERHWYDFWLFDTNKFMSFTQEIQICRDCGYPYIGIGGEEKEVVDEDRKMCECLSPHLVTRVRRVRLAVHWVLKIEPE